jgi:hypothetical protein
MVALPNSPGRPPAAGNGGGAGSSLTLASSDTSGGAGISSPVAGTSAPADASGTSSPDGAPAAFGAASAAPVPAALWNVISEVSIDHLQKVGADTIGIRFRAAEEIRRRSEKLTDPTDADLAMVIAAVLLELAIEHQIAAVDGGAA